MNNIQDFFMSPRGRPTPATTETCRRDVDSAADTREDCISERSGGLAPYVFVALLFLGACPAHVFGLGLDGPGNSGGNLTNSLPDTPQNLIRNPGFEEGTTGWFGFGYSTLSAPTTLPHAGNRSVLVENRTESWNGVAQSLLGVLQPSTTYNISAWVRLASGADQPVRLTFRQIDDTGTSFPAVASGTANSTGWIQLSGAFTPVVNGTLTYLTLYLEGPAPGVSFYADDFAVEVAETGGGNPSVTFQVNMSVQVALGKFNPGADQLSVAGNFNEWAVGANTLVQHPTNTNIYQTTIHLSGAPGVTVVEYKYVIGPTGWENNDVGPGGAQNRSFTLPASTTTLPPVYFNNLTEAVTRLITFQVDMSAQERLGEFDPNTDSVYVAGGDINGWNYAASPLIETGNPGVWEGTFTVPGNAGSTTFYKFVKNTVAGGEQWEANDVGPGGSQDRELVLAPTNQTAPLVFFNNRFSIWEQSSAPIADWSAVACSADGTKLVAVAQNGSIYTSVDAGRTWTPTSAPTNEIWSTVASSADGNTLVAAGFPGPIYVSRDAGATWTQTSAPANHSWAWVACSADGTRIAAVPYEYGSTVGSIVAPQTDGGDRIGALVDGIVIPPGFPLPPYPAPTVSAPIYLSSDAGTTWSAKHPIPSLSGFADFQWTSVAMSEDGSKLGATGIGLEPVYLLGIPIGYTTRGFVYGSGDAGASWSNVGGNGPLWNWVTMAREGSDVLLAGGAVSISRNGGSTWEGVNLPPGNWFSVESSADGTRMVAAEWPSDPYPGRIVSSHDSGATWNLDISPNANWNGVAMSSDGSLAVAPVYQGGIWVSRLVPVIWTHPVGMHVNEGESVEFSVEAESSIGPDFQWLFDGMAIPGARNATLVLTNVQPAQAGVYAVVVSNRLGSVTSSNVWLQVNRYPIARAIATPNPAISSNGTNAVVVLDGSLSSDPDGDTLSHTWYSILDAGDSFSVGTGVVAMAALPIGTNLVGLVLDDGMARDTNTISVTVLTTAEAVQLLISRVNESDLPHPRPFLATLNAALASIQRGNCHSAAGQLHAFQNKAQAQVNDANLALAWVQTAGQVIAALDCGRSSPTAAQIHSLKRHSNGKMRMEIKGEAGKCYILEASTNLVGWTPVGVVRPDEQGNCDYEDADAEYYPCRFYRVVAAE